MKSHPLIIFYLLVGYVFIQFSWWGYHIVDLSSQLGYSERKVWMVIGEGVVFVILLLLGTLKIRNTFKKEHNLNQQQQNFILSVTHELKSPVASIKLYLQTILKHDLKKEKIHEMTTGALLDNERLSSLIDNILLAANMENNPNYVHFEIINLSELLKRMVAKMKNSAEKHKSHIKTAIEPGILVLGDTLLLESVVINLLENALKHSSGSLEIAVYLKKTKQTILLSISDNGIGIPNNEKDRIFDKFYRIGREEIRKTKGTGLGLYIVKSIVEKHHGKIKVKDRLPKGTLFEISFPISHDQ